MKRWTRFGLALALLTQTGCDANTAAAWNSAAYYTASAVSSVAYAASDVAYWVWRWW